MRPVQALHHQEPVVAAPQASSGSKQRGQRRAQPGQLPGGQEIRDDQIPVRGIEPLLGSGAAASASAPAGDRAHRVAGYATASFAISSIASGCSVTRVSPVMPESAQAR